MLYAIHTAILMAATVVTVPLFLLFGRPMGLTKPHKMFEGWQHVLTGDEVKAKFKLASMAMVIEWTPWPWTKAMMKGVAGFALLGHVFYKRGSGDDHHNRETRAHEACHVIQQAIHPLSFVGVGITYLLDLIMWLPWRKTVGGKSGKVAVAETVAYAMTGRREHPFGD